MKAPELTVEESIDALLAPPVTPNAALKFAFEVTYGYIHKISDRFKPGLAFSDRGLARAASVFGWLCGIAGGGNVELAVVSRPVGEWRRRFIAAAHRVEGKVENSG